MEKKRVAVSRNRPSWPPTERTIRRRPEAYLKSLRALWRSTGMPFHTCGPCSLVTTTASCPAPCNAWARFPRYLQGCSVISAAGKVSVRIAIRRDSTGQPSLTAFGRESVCRGQWATDQKSIRPRSVFEWNWVPQDGSKSRDFWQLRDRRSGQGWSTEVVFHGP